MGFLGAALDLLLSERCAGCGTAGGPLCPSCRATSVGPPFRHRPSPVPPGLPPAWALAPYAGVARALIVAHKDHGRAALARPLGAALARAVRAAAEGAEDAQRAQASAEIRGVTGTRAGGLIDGAAGAADRAALLLVPVPSSPASVRRRGGDPMLRIARAAAREIGSGGPAARCLRVLAYRRDVADQAGLTAAERAVNLAGALTARRDLRRTRVIVVDDVITTGATLAEAARALRAAGAEVRAVAVIAATRRLRTGPDPRE